MAPYASRGAGDLPILNAAVKPATGGMNAFVLVATVGKVLNLL